MGKDYFVKYGGLTKAEVLLALYNGAVPNNIFYYLTSDEEKSFDVEDAEKLLKTTTNFDYINNKPIKVDLLSDEGFDSRLYDRDQRLDAARYAILNYMKEHRSDLYEEYHKEFLIDLENRYKKEKDFKQKQLKEAFNKLDSDRQKNVEGLISTEKSAISHIKKGDIVETSAKVVEVPNIKYRIQKFENESIKVQSDIVKYNQQENIVVPKFQTLKFSEYIDKTPNVTNKNGQYVDKNNVEFYFENQKEHFTSYLECVKSLNQKLEEYNNCLNTFGIDSQSRKIFSKIKVQFERNKEFLSNCSNYEVVIHFINSEYTKLKSLAAENTI